ncbi:MAG: hypothetical protein JWO80_2065 [Bryobacterales bacterium]|nr:hypothetical protein [Bryobacterales bacterium]
MGQIAPAPELCGQNCCSASNLIRKLSLPKLAVHSSRDQQRASRNQYHERGPEVSHRHGKIRATSGHLYPLTGNNIFTYLFPCLRQAFSVFGYKSIEIHQGPDPVRDLIGDAADHETTVRVAAENHIREFLPPDQVYDVGDVGGEVDRGRVEMR